MTTPDPTAVATQFFEAMKRSDPAAASEVLLPADEGFSLCEVSEMDYEIGEVSIDGDAARVEAQILSTAASGERETDSMDLVLVAHDGGWKIDLDQTMAAQLGFRPDDMMEAMAATMGAVADGVGGTLESAIRDPLLDACPDDDVPEDGTTIDRSAWGDEFRHAVATFEEEVLDDGSERLSRSIEHAITFKVDWSGLVDEFGAFDPIERYIVDPIISRISVLEHQRVAIVHDKIDAVLIRRLMFGETCVSRQGRTLVVEFQPEELRQFGLEGALGVALDFEREVELRTLRDETLPHIQGRVAEYTPMAIEVDWGVFAIMDSPEAAKAGMRSLYEEVLSNLYNALQAAVEAVPLATGVGRLRIVPVHDSTQSECFAEGADIVLRWPTDASRSSSIEELATLLTGVAAGIAGAAAPGPEPDLPALADGWIAEVDSAHLFPTTLAIYRDRVLPTEIARLQAIAGTAIEVAMDWTGLEENSAAAAQLGPRGLQRVCGAIALLVADEEDREELPRSMQRIAIEFTNTASSRSCYLANGVLTLTLAPESGDGCFREDEILGVLRQAIGHHLRPKVRSLEERAEKWAERLTDIVGAPIQIEVDWRGFTTFTERGDRDAALELLGDSGLDSFYFALSDVCDDEDMLALALRRVRTLRLEHVSDPEQKGLVADGSALVLSQFLHEGDDGYLSQGSIEARICELLATMDNLPGFADPISPDDEDPTDAEGEETGFEHTYATEIHGDDDQLATMIAHMRDAMFPQMLEQMTSMIQRPIDLAVDWTQVTSACRLGSLMTQVGHVMGGLSVVAYDDAYSDHLTARIQRVRVTHADSASCTVADGEMILGIDLDVADGLGGFESMQLGDELKRWLA